MKRGQQVFLAAVVDGEVRAEEALMMRVAHDDAGDAILDRPVFGLNRRVSISALHATRTAALEALAERLEQQAKEERAVASEHITRAERCLVQAERARRMVGGDK